LRCERELGRQVEHAIGRVVVEGAAERGSVGEVAAGGGGALGLRALTADERDDLVPASDELRAGLAAHEPARAGDERLHGGDCAVSAATIPPRARDA